MKKYLFVALLATSLNAYAEKDFKSYCTMSYHSGNPGVMNIDSKHGFSIHNATATTQTYRIIFANYVQYPKLRELPLDYTTQPYVPNALTEYDLVIKSGVTYHYGEVTIAKNAYFPSKGKHMLKASTTIKMGTTTLDTCENISPADIY